MCLSDSLHALAVVRDGGWILWDDVCKAPCLWQEVKQCLDEFLAHPEVRPLMSLRGTFRSKGRWRAFASRVVKLRSGRS